MDQGSKHLSREVVQVKAKLMLCPVLFRDVGQPVRADKSDRFQVLALPATVIL
jgi:hypothetical protein